IDERRGPFKSTVAAGKLLKSNYLEIKSWPLAITAYNHGLVSMKRAVRLTGTRDIGVIVQKYKNRRFRFASKNFYGCFLAASEIGANPGRYFSDFNYHPSQTYNEVVLKSYIRPAALCKHLGISQKELARLNPSLRTSVFHRRMTIPRGFRLRIPFSMLPETAAVKINAIPGTLKASKSNDFHYYSVRRGDTLYRISRRFGVPSEILLAANDINRKNRIYIGQVLRIPGKTPASPVVPPKKVTPRELHSSSFPKPPRIEMETAKTPPVSTTFDATLYNLDVTFFPQKGTARIRVAVDETLGHYADWLGVSTGRIRGLNRLRRNSLRYNQKILLPIGPDETTLERFKNKRLEYHMALEEDFYNQYQVVGFNVRKVKYGETLWSICNNSANGSDGNGEIPLWLFKKYNRQIGIENLRKNTKIKLPIIKESEKTL
ncbi:MAG: LysM peptidoglycan-binding domain-containing protein, partial [bacterium]|nr:LysM peptidoglycan-binding domain-containing protein [bacterium]